MTELLTEQTTAAMKQTSPKAVSEAQQKKHRQTGGEVLFNLGTYGGVTWIANEVISGTTLELFKPADAAKHIKAGAWNKGLERTVDWAHAHANPMKLDKKLIRYPLWFLALTSGGNLLVPVVKWLEDRKGTLVRKADEWIHGEQGRSDPEIIARHTEMDNAPKQSWGSLWKGRGLVMLLALGVDLGLGSESAPTTKLFKNTRVEKYSNIGRASATLTRDLLAWAHPDPEKRRIIREARQTSLTTGVFEHIGPAEGKAAAAMGGNYGFVLIFSLITSALFYFSSHAFAKERDKKLEKTHEKRGANYDIAAIPLATEASNDKPQAPDAPRVTVSHVSDHSTLDVSQAVRAV